MDKRIIDQHPSDEQWMAYLYDELDSTARTGLRTHLDVCEDCSTRIAQWSETTDVLDEWILPASKRQKHTGQISRALVWAVAAMLILCAGLVIGRFSAPPSPNIDQIQATLHEKLGNQLRHEWQQAALDLRKQLDMKLQEELDRKMEQLAAATAATSQAEAQRLVTQFAEAYRSAQTEEQEALLELIRQMESRRLSEYQLLRRDLGVVAAAAGNEIQLTQQGLTQLASYTRNQSWITPPSE